MLKTNVILLKIAPILHIVAKTGYLFSLILTVPTTLSWFYQDSAFNAFATTAISSSAITLLLWLVTRKHHRELRPRDGFTLVFMLWIGFTVIAALPFYLHIKGLSFTDAFFEAISGLTTTGSTVLTDLEHLAPSLNFWRHMLNWLGGMGIIVLAVAILPMLGVGGTQLFKAEIPGVDKDSKMAPRISQTAKKLWGVYSLITLVLVLLLKLAGMSWFDAVCHAMACVALGGFSTHDNSIAYFQSFQIELVIMLGSIIAAMNFTNHFYALKRRSLKMYWKDEEIRLMLALLFGSIIVVALYLWHIDYYSFVDAFRYTAFNYISIALANGFANTDFSLWPLTASLWMFFLANILANAGSTGGGIKTIRALVLFRFSLREMMLLLHPNAVRGVKVNNQSIPDRIALTVLAFIFVYFMTVIIATFTLMITGLDFIPALTGVIACLTNTGPGLSILGPASNYSVLGDLQKWIFSFVMLIGRLEIFTVFVLLTPSYWRK